MCKCKDLQMYGLPLASAAILLGNLLLPPSVHAGFEPKATSRPAETQARRAEVMALLIGESLTPDASVVLAGVSPDVEQMSAALRSLGVATRTVMDVDRAAAIDAINAFAAESPDKVHLLYFSGYGGEEAGIPNALLFMSKDDVARSAAKATDVELRRLRYTLPFPWIGKQLANTAASVIIIDSSLNPQYEFAARQLVATAGAHGREDAKGGYFTQQVTAQLHDLGGSSLLDSLAAAARATRSPDGEEDPVLLLSASMPSCRLEEGKLTCAIEGRGGSR